MQVHQTAIPAYVTSPFDKIPVLSLSPVPPFSSQQKEREHRQVHRWEKNCTDRIPCQYQGNALRLTRKKVARIRNRNIHRIEIHPCLHSIGNDRDRCKRKEDNSEDLPVLQTSANHLTLHDRSCILCSMNKLSLERRAQIVSLLVECTGINPITRITGVSVHTVLKLLADVGEA